MDQALVLERLQEIVRQINHINSAAAVLYWDQTSYAATCAGTVLNTPPTN